LSRLSAHHPRDPHSFPTRRSSDLKVIQKDSIQQLPSHALIFDLASDPGGTDFQYAKQRGVKAILAQSLPGIVAPKTAGKILANVIQQILQERKDQRS